ncbi:hypothetical protein [Pedobacter gandavensis]|uniref:hypothetical protein n=1 Tax=Pedobacter gandavensis TaxID=2679963 RepID=UPI00292E1869|nr:hypothetical protein [Pedobacter gandavensis]
MKRNLLLLISVACLLISCKTENKRHEEFFKQNFASLDSIRIYIEGEIKTKKFDDNEVGILFTSEPQYSKYKNLIFDRTLVLKMNALKIKQIRCVTEQKDECGIFDVIYIQLIANKIPDDKVVYYVYDRCDKFKDFENQKIYQKKLRKNWGILIDRT